MREIKFRAWDKNHFVYMGLKGAGWSFSEPFDEIASAVQWQQFTGLEDKNGKEIYEGDLVRDNIGHQFSIFWSYGGFKLIGTDLSNQLSLMDSHSNWYEVIGSIYENPELTAPKDIK